MVLDNHNTTMNSQERLSTQAKNTFFSNIRPWKKKFAIMSTKWIDNDLNFFTSCSFFFVSGSFHFVSYVQFIVAQKHIYDGALNMRMATKHLCLWQSFAAHYSYFFFSWMTWLATWNWYTHNRIWQFNCKLVSLFNICSCGGNGQERWNTTETR